MNFSFEPSDIPYVPFLAKQTFNFGIALFLFFIDRVHSI